MPILDEELGNHVIFLERDRGWWMHILGHGTGEVELGEFLQRCFPPATTANSSGSIHPQLDAA
jgi:hypothetical protein